MTRNLLIIAVLAFVGFVGYSAATGVRSAVVGTKVKVHAYQQELDAL